MVVSRHLWSSAVYNIPSQVFQPNYATTDVPSTPNTLRITAPVINSS